MRLLLDAHVSGTRIGAVLADCGHDVRALDQEPALEGIGDENVLELAAGDGRILVTFDVADFPVIAREWAQSSRDHAGLLLVYGFTQRQFGPVSKAILAELARQPEDVNWRNRTVIVSRGSA